MSLVASVRLTALYQLSMLRGYIEGRMEGTMAHSFIQAHDDEVEAFEQFAHPQPDNVILLIDTYDTEAAARKAVSLGSHLRGDGIAVEGICIDSSK